MDLSQFDLPRYLSLLPLFQEMQKPELQRLAEGSRLRRLARGEDVFRIGKPCTEFHVTVSGQVKLFAISPQDTLHVASRGSSHLFPLVGMVSGNQGVEGSGFVERSQPGIRKQAARELR